MAVELKDGDVLEEESQLEQRKMEATADMKSVRSLLDLERLPDCMGFQWMEPKPQHSEEEKTPPICCWACLW